MTELAHLNKPWTARYITGLVLGKVAIDPDCKEAGGDGYKDTGASWYEQRCRSLDKGDGMGAIEAIQLEQRLAKVRDSRERLAVLAAMHGWDFAVIGSAINCSRTGEALVHAGIRDIARQSNVSR